MRTDGRTDGQTDRRTDEQGESSIPPLNFVSGGITRASSEETTNMTVSAWTRVAKSTLMQSTTACSKQHQVYRNLSH